MNNTTTTPPEKQRVIITNVPIGAPRPRHKACGDIVENHGPDEGGYCCKSCGYISADELSGS